MKDTNIKKIVPMIAGMALVASSCYGLNDRLSMQRSDSGEKVARNVRYEAMQPDDLSNKPVRNDISSKDEMGDQPQYASEEAVKQARYEVPEENRAKAFPANAVPGECYGEVIVPAEYTKRTVKVMNHAGYSKLSTTPAQYEWVEKRVMAREPETRLELVPATYKTVKERVMVEPKRTVTQTMPATFKTETERVMVRPATLKWMDGEAGIDNAKSPQMTGNIVCLVEQEAQYKTVSRKVVDQQARTKTKTIPAKYKVVERTVVDVPAHTREVDVPAEYTTVKVRKLKKEESLHRDRVEPVYTQVDRYVLAGEAHTSWERVLCDTEIKPALAYEIESQLKKKGFSPGKVDGKMNEATKTAMENYQMENGLLKGGITPQTLVELGIADFDSDIMAKSL